MKHVTSSIRSAAHLALWIALISPASVRAQAPASETQETLTLSPFVVTSGPGDGYRATNAISGTRFNTSLLDIPKPVEVITAEFIKDLAATQLTNVLQYASGVSQTGAPGADDITSGQVALRGFNTGTAYRNGYRTSFIVDPLMIDRIEVIKGPSSVFSGPIEPGGTINIITIRPTARQTDSVSLRYGDYDRFRGQVISSGPLNAKGTMGYRLAAAVENYGSYQDFAGRDRYVVAGTYTWQTSPKGFLQVDAQFVNNRVSPAADIPYLNGTSTGFEPNVSHKFNRQGPFAKSQVQQLFSTADYTYTLNSRWSLRAGSSYSYQSLQPRLLIGGSTRVTTNATTKIRTVARTATYEPNADSLIVSPQAYLLGKFEYAGIQQSLILGGEYFYNWQRNDVYVNNTATNNLASLNIDNPGPVANYSFGDLITGYKPSDFRRVTDIETGLSASNVFTLLNRRLTLLQSVRRSTVHVERRNLFANTLSTTDTQDVVQGYGASYRVFRKLSAFASYNESFIPQTVFDYQGRILDPIKGSGWDYGLKYDLIDGRLTGSVTGYDITRANAPLADPVHTGAFIPTAETAAKGVDFNLLAKPAKNWQLVFNYGYCDARTTKDSNTPANIGSRFANIPRHQGSVWNRYRFTDGPLKGFAIGVGVVRAGERRGNPSLADLPGLRLPAYTAVDANLSYDKKLFGRLCTLGVVVNNATDKEYLVSYTSYAEPRVVTGTLSVRF